MKPNVGTLDRLVRIVVGLLMLSTGLFLLHGAVAAPALVIGSVGLISGLTARCPTYLVLGIDTRRGPSLARGR